MRVGADSLAGTLATNEQPIRAKLHRLWDDVG